jgi:DNA-binding LytR/AlgR family response regulator
VLFLDIRMPGVDGFEVARAAAGAHIVFITAYDEFAVAAFEHEAVDYLLKPVRRDRLQASIGRVKARVAAGRPSDVEAALTTIASRLQPATESIRWLTAGVGSSVKLISVDDVLFFGSEDKYTRVVTTTDTAHIRIPLKELASGLDPDAFWQVHRSAVVRVSAIKAAVRSEDGKLRLVLHGTRETLPVSATYAHRFKSM